jgi:hypothetical protein
MKYRKKPIVIDAVRWMTDNWNEIANFLGQGDCSFDSDGRCVLIKTLEGTMKAEPFDYIVRGVKGECYPVKPEIFEATYEVSRA